LTVVVQAATNSTGLPTTNQISAWVRAGIGNQRAGELTVRIGDEAESADLNARFRRTQSPTNVLAFEATADWPDNAVEQQPIGDLVVCAPVLAREAEEQGKALEAHWAHIVIHGTLHLLGFDHETVADASQMEARERRILAGLGFADPYV
jgi:probable rRNA maturation factor